MQKIVSTYRLVFCAILLALGFAFISSSPSFSDNSMPADEAYASYDAVDNGLNEYERTDTDIRKSTGITHHAVFRIKCKRYKRRYFLGARQHEREFIKEPEAASPHFSGLFFDEAGSSVFSHVSSFYLCKPTYYLFLHLYTLF